MEIFQVLLLLIVFGSLLFLAMVTTKYIGSKAQNAMKGKYINIVETINLGMDKRIHLLKVGNQYVLIASNGKNIEFLTNVNLEETLETVDDSTEITSFSAVFSKYINNFKDMKVKKSKNDIDIIDVEQSGEIFRNNLDKLKDITREADKM